MNVFYHWRPYVSVAQRRLAAALETQRLRKKGHPVSPVAIEGRAIARTFWGRAWCENLERYSDFANRLPRGRTYVRNGSVVDLQVSPGEVRAIVSGSSLYRVAVKVAAVPRKHWAAICSDCAGGIDSLVELLQGRFSKGVMERICRPGTGLFPAPAEIHLSCSCPDWATMCKHVAAVLYGVGARLDERPELLFALRQVDEKELVARAGKGLPLSHKQVAEGRLLAEAGLSELFDLELGTTGEEAAPARTARRATTVPARPVPARGGPPPAARRGAAAKGAKATRRRPRGTGPAQTAPPAARAKAKPRARKAKGR